MATFPANVKVQHLPTEHDPRTGGERAACGCDYAQVDARCIVLDFDITAVPEHMRDAATYYLHWAPEFYEESECKNCEKPIYRYMMDLIIEWKHVNHGTYCSTLRAVPKS